MKIATSTESTQVKATSEVTGKVEKNSGRRIGYNYVILKSLKESQKNDVVKCLYIKSLTRFGLCVVKEGTAGDTKDAQGRDIKDRLIWQKELHSFLQDKVRVPRYLDHFEENGNYYLVIEHIHGKPLHQVRKDCQDTLRRELLCGGKKGFQFLDYLLQILDILEVLHLQGIVHRDVTAANFIVTKSNKLAVIDLELSYSLHSELPSPPFQLGTYGYMSPEQEATAPPLPTEDIFSFGALTLFVFTGISPTKLTGSIDDELADRISFFIPIKPLATMIIACLHKEASRRPKLSDVRKVLHDYIQFLKTKPKIGTERPVISRARIHDTIQNCINTIGSSLLSDEQGWFAENLNVPPPVEKFKINKAYYASFNRGVAGIMYFLAQAHKTGYDIETTRPLIHKSLDMIASKYIDRIDKATPGLHFGSDGIAVSLMTAINTGLLQNEPLYNEWIELLLTNSSTSSGVEYGVAGQGLANLLCLPFTESNNREIRLQIYVSALLSKQQNDGSWLKASGDKKKGVATGFAHGMAGIAYFLLEYGKKFNEEKVLQAAFKGLHWLKNHSYKTTTGISWRSASGKKVGSWWCEGGAGISLTFMKAYEITADPTYKKLAVGALSNHDAQLVFGNLSQCHGLSGLGEIYLTAYKVLQQPQWLNRAAWLVEHILHLKKEHPKHGAFWTVEEEKKPVANFMVGNAGVLHFLMRYENQHLPFPLMP